MVKIKKASWVEKDDPMFTGRFSIFSYRNKTWKNTEERGALSNIKNEKKIANQMQIQKNPQRVLLTLIKPTMSEEEIYQSLMKNFKRQGIKVKKGGKNNAW